MGIKFIGNSRLHIRVNDELNDGTLRLYRVVKKSYVDSTEPEDEPGSLTNIVTDEYFTVIWQAKLYQQLSAKNFPKILYNDDNGSYGERNCLELFNESEQCWKYADTLGTEKEIDDNGYDDNVNDDYESEPFDDGDD